MAVCSACYGLTCLAMDKVLFNVILGHFHRRAAQACSVDYMHWQLAQQQNQNTNWEAEMQVGNTMGTH